MKRNLLFLLALGLALPSFALPALGAPTKLHQQGRLLDGDGEPFEGSHALIFGLYDAETEGVELWTEERSADFDTGYYAITLGEQVPLDDLLFAGDSVWLELTVDGETLSPRQPVVSVPYALRATAAEHLEGGLVDAEEISVDGVVVIDAAGNWVGPSPEISWDDLADVPADLADGDQDEDTLAGLVCTEGQLPKWDEANGMWICGDDIDTDTTDPNTDTLLTLVCTSGQVAKWDGMTWACADDLDTDTDTQLDESQVDAMVADNGYSSGPHTINTDTQLSEAQVDTMVANNGYSSGPHTVDTDTQLSEAQVDTMVANNGYSSGPHTINTDTQLSEAQVDAYVGDNGYSLGAHTSSLPWGSITGIPSDLADGDADSLGGLSCLDGDIARWDNNLGLWFCDADNQTTTLAWSSITGIPSDLADGDNDTQLSEAQVDTMVANNGYSSGPHTINTDTQLSEAQVDTMVANNGYSSGPHTVDTDTQLTEAQVDSYVANNGYSTGPHTIDTNTQLSDAQVDAFVSNAPIDLFAGSTIDGQSMVEAFAGAIYEGVGQFDNLGLGTAKAYCLPGDIAISGACWAAAGSLMKSAQTDSEGHYCVAERVDTSVPNASVYAGVRCLDLP